MTLRRIMSLATRITLLTCVSVAVFIAASMVVGLTDDVSSSASTVQQSSTRSNDDPAAYRQQQMEMAFCFLAVCVCQTMVISFVVLNARMSGIPLILVTAAILFGTITVMSRTEMLYFFPSAHSGYGLLRVVASGALHSTGVAVAAVILLGRLRAPTSPLRALVHLGAPPRDWALRLTAAAVAYAALYFTFGYFIVWSDPTARQFYGGDTASETVPSLFTVISGQPRLIAFQLLRGLMWTGLGILVIRLSRFGRPATTLTVALVLGVLFPAQLLIPNSWMSEHLRMLHLLETGSSMIVFGALVGRLFARPSNHARSVAETVPQTTAGVH